MRDGEIGLFSWMLRTTALRCPVAWFFGVFLFPYLMHWKGLPAAESAAAITCAAGLLVTLWMLPETKGRSLEELSAERATPAERAA